VGTRHAQVYQGGRFLDRLHPGQVDLPRVVEADLGVDGQSAAGLPVGGIQRPGMLGQQRAGVLRQAERRQHVTADRFPRSALQEPGLPVAPLGAGVGIDLAALQMPPELLQHGEGTGVPVHRTVRVLRVAHLVGPSASWTCP
jgi:hypothetical protein